MISLLDFTKFLKEIKSYKKFFQRIVKTAIHHTLYETNATLTPKPTTKYYTREENKRQIFLMDTVVKILNIERVGKKNSDTFVMITFSYPRNSGLVNF